MIFWSDFPNNFPFLFLNEWTGDDVLSTASRNVISERVCALLFIESAADVTQLTITYSKKMIESWRFGVSIGKKVPTVKLNNSKFMVYSRFLFLSFLLAACILLDFFFHASQLAWSHLLLIRLHVVFFLHCLFTLRISVSTATQKSVLKNCSRKKIHVAVICVSGAQWCKIKLSVIWIN